MALNKTSDQMEMFGYTAEGSQQDAEKYIDKNAAPAKDITFMDAAKFVAELTPIIGDAMAAKEVYNELQKDDPNYFLAGALGGAAIIGLVPGIGDAAASAIRAGAKKALDVGKRIEIDPDAVGMMGGNIRIRPKEKPFELEDMYSDDFDWGRLKLTDSQVAELANVQKSYLAAGGGQEAVEAAQKKVQDAIEARIPAITESLKDILTTSNKSVISLDDYKNAVEATVRFDTVEEAAESISNQKGILNKMGPGMMDDMLFDDISMTAFEKLPDNKTFRYIVDEGLDRALVDWAVKEEAIRKSYNKYRKAANKNIKTFKKGGVLMEDQMQRAFMADEVDVDPVSGNEVPPGSLPEEVRDDIPAMLSEGEYVVPADVLRYYGVKFFEDLRMMAKVGLAEMEANGRIGGEPIEEQAELPFTDDELLTEEDEMEPEDEQMSAAFGGLVGFAPGGLNMPEGTQVPTSGSLGFAQDPNDPTQVLIGSGRSSTGYELVTFYGPGGAEDKVNIPFFNGMAIAPIPPNYTRDVPQETELEKSTSDSRDPVDPTLMEKVLAKQEKDKPIDYKNPDSVLQAIDTYYSSGPMFKAFGPVGFGADIGISKYEKSNLLSNIDETLNDNEFTSANPDAAKTIADHKQLLLDKDAYQAQSTEERGFGDWLKDLFGFGDGSFSLKNDPIPPKPSGMSNEDWSASTLGDWVDATNLVQSLHPSDDPIAYHKAIKAQSDASRAASAAARAAAAEKETISESASQVDEEDASNIEDL